MQRILVVLSLAAAAPVAAAPAADLALPVGGGVWEGATQEVAAGPDGPSRLVWSFTDMAGLSSRSIPHDWTPYHALAFTLRCTPPTDNALTIVMASEDPEADGMDYYSFTLKLDVPGPRSVIIPFTETASVRHPAGWHRIDSLRLHNNWARRPTVAPQEVIIEGLRLLAIPPRGVKGPRLEDADFFDLLDLDRPELAAVRDAWRSGRVPEARQALAEHLRRRQLPRWLVAAADRPTLGMPVQKQRAGTGAGGGRLQTTVVLDREGWYPIEVPLNAFLPLGKPVGWHWVSALSITWQALGDPHDGRELLLDDIRLAGPGVSRSLGDFASHATGWRGLSRVASGAAAGDACGRWSLPALTPTVSCTAFPGDWSPYDRLSFRVCAGRAGDRLRLTVASEYPDTRRADEIRSRTFVIGGFREHPYAFGPRIDWSANAMQEGESRTVEWNAQLNRHFH
ncbi:MAG: hypothetical protein JXR77_02145, partial [Lentisphaeria bacterium]|nr:hypothetical protein [Lentisphaeria bacterium]